MSDVKSTLGRREFVKTIGVGTAATSLLPSSLLAGPARPVRYAIVGTGNRGSITWGQELLKAFGDKLELVGLYDVNRKRMDAARHLIGVKAPGFGSFDEMCDRVRPELVVITTVDRFHSDYVVKALDHGLQVLTEKPMATTEEQCQAILDAEKRSGQKIIVTFNYRYAPKHQKIKEILLEGEIGRILSVDFSWYLDIYHGADYFRRWHRLKSMSGSLLVHKATHHFDLINWWLDADPVEVVAYGDLKHYGRSGPFRHTHCRPCPHRQECAFFWDITKDPVMMELYVSAESEDGYHRDGCVFREDVDIYDTMSALVRYSNGVVMNYSLNAAMPFEGYRIAFNGEKGRLEVRDYERQPWPESQETDIQLVKSFGTRRRIPAPKVEGGHFGGDERLREAIFGKTRLPAYMKLPDSRAGALACLTGIAARHSIGEQRVVKIQELVRL